LSGCVMMPVRSPLSRWPPTAQLRSRCLGVFSLYSLCKQWTVLCFDHCLWLSCFLMQWPILSATAGVTPVLFATFVIVHVLQVSSAFCITSTSRYSLAPHFLRQSTSCATPTISPLCFRALFSFVLQSALTLPLHQGPHTTTTRSALCLAAPGLSLICTPMPQTAVPAATR
jgi:hypothetical protein